MAVAGAVAQELITAYQRPGITRAWVNNGGDIALHLAPVPVERIGDEVADGTTSPTASASASTSASPLALRRIDKPAFPGEELVVVASPFFPHKLSKGYSNPQSRVIESVNGIKVKSLKHLIEVLRDSRDEFIVFEFSGRSGESPVFPRKEVLASIEDILTDNGVRSQASPELLAVWNEKPKS